MDALRSIRQVRKRLALVFPDFLIQLLPAAAGGLHFLSTSFKFVRVSNGRAFISGHGPQADDGAVAGPFGKVGKDLSVEQGYAAARRVGIF